MIPGASQNNKSPGDFCYEDLRPTYTHEVITKLLELGHLKYIISQVQFQQPTQSCSSSTDFSNLSLRTSFAGKNSHGIVFFPVQARNLQNVEFCCQLFISQPSESCIDRSSGLLVEPLDEALT